MAINIEFCTPVLDHVSNLSAHGDIEECKPVEQQDGPEHWDIKHTEEGETEPNKH